MFNAICKIFKMYGMHGNLYDNAIISQDGIGRKRSKTTKPVAGLRLPVGPMGKVLLTKCCWPGLTKTNNTSHMSTTFCQPG